MIDFENKAHIHKEILEKMGKVLLHRGPDQQDIYIDDRVGLEHNRLAIKEGI